jgi:hypothetical protein
VKVSGENGRQGQKNSNCRQKLSIETTLFIGMVILSSNATYKNMIVHCIDR